MLPNRLPVAMNRSMPVNSAPRRESVDSILAKNLVAARVIAGLTQHELAAAAGVSRATVAQLETGYSDPRLSTVVDLARALGIAPIVLLSGSEEVGALAAIAGGNDAAGPRPTVPPIDLARMRDYVASGMLKDRIRAARIGATVARGGVADGPVGAAVTAGLFSATLPGHGTVVGTLLGKLLQ
jgi:transcriptional regulator with XRE-family HTH domain